MYYELIELGQKETRHPLDFENVADINCCVNIVNSLKKAIKHDDQKKIKEIIRSIPNIDCLPETVEKMSKVFIPYGTDY